MVGLDCVTGRLAQCCRVCETADAPGVACLPVRSELDELTTLSRDLWLCDAFDERSMLSGEAEWYGLLDVLLPDVLLPTVCDPLEEVSCTVLPLIVWDPFDEPTTVGLEEEICEAFDVLRLEAVEFCSRFHGLLLLIPELELSEDELLPELELLEDELRADVVLPLENV